MLAHSSHRWSATGLQRGTTLPGAPAESALASAFLEPAGQNAAGATRLAKVCPSASSNPGARVRVLHEFRCRVGVAGLRRINQHWLAPLIAAYAWQSWSVGLIDRLVKIRNA